MHLWPTTIFLWEILCFYLTFQYALDRQVLYRGVRRMRRYGRAALLFIQGWCMLCAVHVLLTALNVAGMLLGIRQDGGIGD